MPAPDNHPDRLFPIDAGACSIARELYASVTTLPLIANGAIPADRFSDAATKDAARLSYESGDIIRLQIEQSPLGDLAAYEALRTDDWQGKIVPVYCADEVIDPETPGFVDHLDRLGQLTGCDAYTWKGYLEAHGIRRDIFKLYGCRATVHRHPSARAENLDPGEKTALFRKVCIGKANQSEAELFRAVMLMEMARMCLDDGLALHIHAGQGRAAQIAFGDGKSVEVAFPVDYARAAKPLLSEFSQASALKIVFFAADVHAAANQLAPLSLALPAVQFGLSGGAANSVGRLRDFREQIISAGAALRVAPLQPLSDDIAALPAQSDTARRVDCSVLATLVARHEIPMDEATLIARYWATGSAQ